MFPAIVQIMWLPPFGGAELKMEFCLNFIAAKIFEHIGKMSVVDGMKHGR